MQQEYDKLYVKEQEAARRWLDALTTAFTVAEKRTVADVSTGDPASMLLHVAEQERADLIVVGSHGLTGIRRFLLGSVSEKALRHAHCSVLVVK